jgi:hypothetical protein
VAQQRRIAMKTCVSENCLSRPTVVSVYDDRAPFAKGKNHEDSRKQWVRNYLSLFTAYGKEKTLRRIDYKDVEDNALYRPVKLRVPEMPINNVDDSNRETVLAVLRVTEKLRQLRQERAG